MSEQVMGDIGYDVDDEGYRNQTIQFLYNLIHKTSHETKLAYSIAHYMEANFLDINGLSSVFPLVKKEHKKLLNAFVKEQKKLEQQIAFTQAENRGLRKDAKKTSEDMRIVLQETIAENLLEIKESEERIKEINKLSEYKPRYPMKNINPEGDGVDLKDWDILKDWFAKEIKKRKSSEGNLFKNINTLCQHLGFSDKETNLLKVLIVARDDNLFQTFVDNISQRRQKNVNAVLARMIDVPRDEIAKMLQPDSPLVEKGLVVSLDYMLEEDDQETIPEISAQLIRMLKEPDMTLEKMLKRMIGEPSKTHLDWDKDFSYLGKEGDEVVRLLEGVKNGQNIKGLNVLFYGLQGTGKTEAVKAAAQKAGIELYMVGEEGEYGTEPTREDRISSALLAQALLADKKDAAILLDEMDDLFPNQPKGLFAAFEGSESSTGGNGFELGGQSPQGMSKVYLNRLLEDNNTLTFWTANKPESFDPAFRRRITFSIKFQIPPAPVRERMWDTVLLKYEFDNISKPDIRKLSSQFVVAPSLIDNAVRQAKVTDGDLNTIHRSLRASSRLVFGSGTAINSKEELPQEYDLRLVSAKVEDSDLNLTDLANNIKDKDHKNFSMLLYGIAGSGKSMYFRYLAQHLGMDILLKKASSLRDKYVGETEKRIAEAFAEAEERNMLLVLDEANTFLRDREKLSENWEVSAVEEMLVQMETFKQPFLCTTNLFQDIDVAAKRRFLFKIGFDYLTKEQKEIAFQTYFNMDAPPEIESCAKLTPAEYSNVRRKIPFMNGDVTPERIVGLLMQEMKSRDNNQATYDGRPDGFGFAKK